MKLDFLIAIFFGLFAANVTTAPTSDSSDDQAFLDLEDSSLDADRAALLFLDANKINLLYRYSARADGSTFELSRLTFP